MAGGADNLNATVKCGLIRLGAYECRQERVMYVDYLIGISGNHAVANDLHVTRQHDEIDIILLKQFQHCGLLLQLVVLCDGVNIIRYAEHIGHMLHVRVVAHYERYLHVPFTCAVTCQQVKQAM